MIYHLSQYSPDPGKYWLQLGEGLAHGVTHPVQFGEQIIDLPALEQHGVAYWLGNMTPAVAAAFLTGGAAAAARGTETLTIVDSAGEGASALARVEATAVGAGRLDYSRDFAADLRNFEDESGLLHEGRLSRPMIVVQYGDSTNPEATYKWWTPVSEANQLSTIDEVHQRLALLPEWGNRDVVRVAVIPRDTPAQFISGAAGSQESGGVTYAGHGLQIRFRDFDPKWIRETRRLP
jgi:hypothetical protein